MHNYNEEKLKMMLNDRSISPRGSECGLCLPAGLEQSKARGDEADKDADMDDGSGAKDQLIRRKFPAMLGQAISVVGGYPEKASEAPATKKLPEPILPAAQTK